VHPNNCNQALDWLRSPESSNREGPMSQSAGSQDESAKILLLDDEQRIALTLAAILRVEGYQVATAFSGQEAITKAASFIPDLLLSDICMDGMNGIETAKRITAKLPDCKVLFISGHATMPDLANADTGPMTFEFVPKPIHPGDLLKLIPEMLSLPSIAGTPAAAH
jgi:CheY-like chemotaxis protein